MIINSILGVIFDLVNLLLSPLDAVVWSLGSLNFEPLKDFLSVIYYILPIDDLKPIIVCIISLFVFRIVISLVKGILDLIPFVR